MAQEQPGCIYIWKEPFIHTTSCGREVTDDEWPGEFCPYCGKKILNEEIEKYERTKETGIH